MNQVWLDLADPPPQVTGSAIERAQKAQQVIKAPGEARLQMANYFTGHAKPCDPSPQWAFCRADHHGFKAAPVKPCQDQHQHALGPAHLPSMVVKEQLQ